MTRLVDAFIPWFARIQAFAQAPDGRADEVAQRVERWFAQARAGAASLPCAPEQARLAAYAAAVWADERLQTCGWEDAAGWERHLLQRRHFGVSDAGEGFFRHLGQLDPQHAQAREVFALALLLGLRGRHALDPSDGSWSRLREQVVDGLLPESRAADDALLVGVPAGAPPAARPALAHWRAHRAAWATVVLSALALAVLYATYAWLLHWTLHAWVGGA